MKSFEELALAKLQSLVDKNPKLTIDMNVSMYLTSAITADDEVAQAYWHSYFMARLRKN